MKKRKILLFIVFALMLIPFLNVKAFSCEYKREYNNQDVTYRIDFDSNNKITVYNNNRILLSKKTYFSYLDNVSECPKDENIYIKETDDTLVVRSSVSCGKIEGIPGKIPEITSLIVTIVQIAVPVILVLMGTLDLFKGITAQKEDEIKKGQQMFIKRLIVGAIIFFVIVIVKVLISIVADSTNDTNNITECIDCFLSGTDNCRR